MKPLIPFLALWGVPLQVPNVLTLEETLRRIEQNHPKLGAARLEVASVRGKARAKRGAFDPVISAGSSALRYNSSTSQGKAYETSENEAVVEATTPYGLKLFAGARLNTGNIKSPASNTGDAGEYFFGVKIPLLRDAGVNEKRVGAEQALLDVAVAEQAVAAFRLGLLRDGAAAYWDWVAANERRTIGFGLLELARTRADAVRRRYEAGDVPKIDAVEADTEVRRREGALVKADRELRKAELKLGLYLWGPDATPEQIDAVSPPLDNSDGALVPDLKSAQEKAVAGRPEIQSFEPAERSLRLARDLAINDRRPALDLVAVPATQLGSGSVNPTWKLGLSYSVPLRQNFAGGRREEAEAKLRKLALDRANAVQAVRTEVADASNAVETARERVRLARQELTLARQLEAGERARFNLGEGTLFLLNQRERATAEAASRLVDTLAELRLAESLLRAATGDF